MKVSPDDDAMEMVSWPFLLPHDFALWFDGHSIYSELSQYDNIYHRMFDENGTHV